MKAQKKISCILLFLFISYASMAINFNADLGTLNPGGTITQSGSTVGYRDVYGNGSPDYIYRVYISGATTLTVNTCGCGWDSYLHVLNASDTRLAYDDDACGGASSQISGLSIPSAGYYFIVVDGYSSSNSGYYTLTISSTASTANLTGGTISIGNTSVSSGSSPGTFSNVVSPAGGTGSYVYQWQQSADNANWSNISGANYVAYSVPALYATTYFRRMVTSGTTAYSNTVQLTVTIPSVQVTSVNGMTGAVSVSLSNSASGTQRTIGITNGTGTTIDVADNDNSSTNELQSISVSGSTLSISNGNSVTLPTATYPGAGIPVSTGSGWTTSIANNSAYWNMAYAHSAADGDLSATNEIQTLSLSGNTLAISGGNSVALPSQTLSISGSTLAISGGNSVTLPSSATYPAAGIPVSTGSGWGTSIVNNSFYWNEAYTHSREDNDESSTNEIQTLSVNGNTLSISGGNSVTLPTGGGTSLWETSGSNIYFNDGSVSIGSITNFPTGYALAVSGKIIAEEVKVKTLASGWPDYVFGKDYQLKPLSEVEKHIKAYGHLPEVPSAGEVKKNGIGLSEMDQILLKKVEELTLYVLELEKQVNELKTRK